ncbi:MAG: Gfo/Idh/MocA family oxidoreductase [Phenylobacterium sp.]|nr:Gfo/Idh/MocA family oxidoreductase [Phenylobacterium sp.]
MTDRVLRFGVIGLSRGFVLSRPMFRADPRARLVAAADPRPEARDAFVSEFGGRAYETAEELCADPDVEVVYVASPHGMHVAHASAAARAGKHVLVEKPMALTLAGCRAMRAAAEAGGVRLLAGPSHGYDGPVVRAADLIASGRFGALRMLSLLNFTDFMYRPRRPEELDPATGGGVVFSQAAHQVDVARRLAGAPVASLRAQVLGWDAARGGEGAYQALLTFENGVSASLTYSGYGRFDSDALMGWVGELGQRRSPDDYGAARRRLAGADEDELKRLRAYGSAPAVDVERVGHEHFGFVVASCELADLRPTAAGVEVYGQNRGTIDMPRPEVPRQGVMDEMWAAVVDGQPVPHDGAWGEANLAVCLAMLKSSREGREVLVSEVGDEP